MVRIVRIVSSRGVFSTALDWTTKPSTSGSLQSFGPTPDTGAGGSPWHRAGREAWHPPGCRAVPEACACHTAQCEACPHHLVVWGQGSAHSTETWDATTPS